MNQELFQEVYLNCSELSPLLSEVLWPLGKSIRPKFGLTLAFFFSKDPLAEHGLMELCKTIECIHIASLLHDDVVDEGVIRRSRPCFYHAWGQRRAILLGDYLLSVALNYLSKIRNPELLSILQSAISQMTLGQIQEEAMSWSHGIKDYEEIVLKKTASLFSATAKAVCALFQVKDSYALALESCGKLIGFCFQLQDDLQDYTGTKKDKKRFQDFFQSRITAPFLWLREQVSQEMHSQLKVLWNFPTLDHAHRLYELMAQYHIPQYGEEQIKTSKTYVFRHLQKYWSLESVNSVMKFFSC